MPISTVQLTGGTKTLRLSRWTIGPEFYHIDFNAAIMEVGFKPTWDYWNPVVPGGSPQAAGQVSDTGDFETDYNRFGAVNYPGVTAPNVSAGLLKEFSFYPSSHLPPTWPTQNFVLKSWSQPYITGRSRMMPGLGGFPDVLAYEIGVDVTVDYPDRYLTVPIFVHVIPAFGVSILYPGELFNIHLQWSTNAPVLPNGLSIGPAFHFVGGVQEYLNPSEDFLGFPTPPDYYMAARSNPSEPDMVTTTISGLRCQVQVSPMLASDEVSPIYGVGLGVKMLKPDHRFLWSYATSPNYEFPNPYLNNGYDYWDYAAFIRGGPLESTLQLSDLAPHNNLYRTYFLENGRFLLAGNPLQNVGTAIRSDIYRITTPEQRTSVVSNGSTLDVGGSEPTSGFEYLPFDSSKSLLKIKTYYAMEPLQPEDSSCRALGAFPNFVSQMQGSGLSLFVNECGLVYGTWWQQLGGSSFQYLSAPFNDTFNTGTPQPPNYLNTTLKQGEKWVLDENAPSNAEGPVYQLKLPDLALRIRLIHIPGFLGGTMYQWSDFAEYPRGENGGLAKSMADMSVKLVWGRSPASPIDGGFAPRGQSIYQTGGQVETVDVATLAAIPFCPMPILSEHENGSSRLFLTDGMSGCWVSEDMGDSWADLAEWTPAFEAPLLPLDASFLPGGGAWGAIALDIEEEPPKVYFRRSFDLGKTWDERVGVGQLADDAPVWGCALANWQHQAHGRILIANFPDVKWHSDDYGETWSESI